MNMQSKEERVHKVFENISSEYDKMNAVISFQQHTKWRNDTMNRMKVQRGKKALDVCCGTADWSVSMAEAVGEEGSVIGLDFSANMLEVGQQKINKLGMKNIELVHGNAMDMPFADNSFDYVTIGFGLRNVPDAAHVLKEMHRVLKPGGIAVCLETSQPTLPGYRQLFQFYFRYIMPLFGKVFAKSYQEYSWLQESARDFPGMKELAKLFEEAGFTNVTYKSYSGGAAASHFGRKMEQ